MSHFPRWSSLKYVLFKSETGRWIGVVAALMQKKKTENIAFNFLVNVYFIMTYGHKLWICTSCHVAMDTGSKNNIPLAGDWGLPLKKKCLKAQPCERNSSELVLLHTKKSPLRWFRVRECHVDTLILHVGFILFLYFCTSLFVTQVRIAAVMTVVEFYLNKCFM